MESLALGFALLGAVGYGAASVLQAIGAARTSGTLGTLTYPWYLTGVCLDLLAWLASLVALGTLPVYQVQAILAASIAVTVLLARVLLSHRLRRLDLVAIALTRVALAVLAASSGPQQPAHLGFTVRLGLALSAMGVALLGGVTVLAGRPALTGATGGLAFGGAALCARAVTVPGSLTSHPVHALATIAADPLSWGLAGFAITGMLLYAQALEHGAVGPVTAMLWICEVVAPSVVGAILLGDTVRPGWQLSAVLALVTAVVAAGVLSMSGGAAPAAARPTHPAPARAAQIMHD